MRYLGEVIKKNRVERGFKSKELAEKVGITYQWLWKIENNKQTPHLEVLESIVNIFNINLSQLMREAEIMEENDITR